MKIQNLFWTRMNKNILLFFEKVPLSFKRKYYQIFCSTILIGSVLFSTRNLPAEILKVEYPFYLYSDFGIKEKHHFFPVGKMGQGSDISLVENIKINPFLGASCIRVRYRPKNKGTWAGIYWLHPANNWGKLPDEGYDLRDAKRLVFFGRGENGNEIASFKVGGIRSRFGDTTTIPLDNVTFEKEWKEYTLDLSQFNLERIVGAFCISLSEGQNPQGATVYLDEIRFET